MPENRRRSKELSDRGLPDVIVSSTGCLKACDNGPVMVVYPENWWFGRVRVNRPSTQSSTPWKRDGPRRHT